MPWQGVMGGRVVRCQHSSRWVQGGTGLTLLVFVGVFFGSCSSLMGAGRGHLCLKPYFFVFIEEVCCRAPQVDNLGTTISVLLLNGVLFTIIGIRDSLASTGYPVPLVRPLVTQHVFAPGCRDIHGSHRPHTYHHSSHSLPMAMPACLWQKVKAG